LIGTFDNKKKKYASVVLRVSEAVCFIQKQPQLITFGGGGIMETVCILDKAAEIVYPRHIYI